MMNRLRIAWLPWTVAALMSSMQPATSFADTDVAAGRALFIAKGCYECHGISGQGSISTGPTLAPHPIALTAMQAYVHAPKGQMPPFSRKILSDDDITKMHAYLASIPDNPPASSIALLNDGRVADARPRTAIDHGSELYSTHCAACHGTQGGGGVGPSLVGLSARMSVDGIEARIRQPSGIMPRLYPATIGATDVEDVARYVASLK